MIPRRWFHGPPPVVAAVVGALVLTAVLGGYLAYRFLVTSATATDQIGAICDGWFSEVNFTYKVPPGGFLSSTYGVYPAACAEETVAAGSTLSLILFLHSNDGTNSQMVQAATVASPFSDLRLSPALPVTIGPGGNATFNATVVTPTTGGSYPGPTAQVTVA